MQLIKKLMDSYIEENPDKPDLWFVKKFDALYDMELQTLQYLSEIRFLRSQTKLKKV